jgi:hypothetical protein
MATDAPEEPKTRNRAKTERFLVFRAEEDGVFKLITDNASVEVTARGDEERRRIAVALATQEWAEERKSGTFATCIPSEFKTMTRKRKVEPVDEWA